MVKRHRRATDDAMGTLARDCSLLRYSLTRLHLEAYGFRLLVYHRLDPCLLAFLGREPERAHQRHHRAAGGVRAFHRASPEPGDNCRLATAVFFRQLNLWVEMANPLLGFISHPLAVVAHVLC